MLVTPPLPGLKSEFFPFASSSPSPCPSISPSAPTCIPPKWPNVAPVPGCFAPAADSCLTVLPELSIGLLNGRGAQHAYETITLARFRLPWLTDEEER